MKKVMLPTHIPVVVCLLCNWTVISVALINTGSTRWLVTANINDVVNDAVVQRVRHLGL